MGLCPVGLVTFRKELWAQTQTRRARARGLGQTVPAQPSAGASPARASLPDCVFRTSARNVCWRALHPRRCVPAAPGKPLAHRRLEVDVESEVGRNHRLLSYTPGFCFLFCF